ncbi:hypothetical protein [Streptomyces sp.]|uniref:hypothetical protein n=1 Tax=Streptomyces sp. TaxID=1931 RepID=UPI0028121F4D|nr:hypothetical protein [Streptomyces sp.]
MNVDDDLTAEDPPAPLLPLLPLAETRELMLLLAAVRDGGQPDRGVAGRLLSELAARVPSQD